MRVPFGRRQARGRLVAQSANLIAMARYLLTVDGATAEEVIVTAAVAEDSLGS